MAIVIGIGGVSRAGKGTLSSRIQKWYPDLNIVSLNMDDFVYPKDQLTTIRGEIDWEVPESVNYSKLATSIAEEKKRNHMVIVEGILIYNDEKLLALYDKKIFVEVDYETFKVRKKLDKRWKIPDWYIEHIWTSYIVHGRTNIDDSLKVDGTREFEQELIMNYIGDPLGS